MANAPHTLMRQRFDKVFRLYHGSVTREYLLHEHTVKLVVGLETTIFHDHEFVVGVEGRAKRIEHSSAGCYAHQNKNITSKCPQHGMKVRGTEGAYSSFQDYDVALLRGNDGVHLHALCSLPHPVGLLRGSKRLVSRVDLRVPLAKCYTNEKNRYSTLPSGFDHILGTIEKLCLLAHVAANDVLLAIQDEHGRTFH